MSGVTNNSSYYPVFNTLENLPPQCLEKFGVSKEQLSKWKNTSHPYSNVNSNIFDSFIKYANNNGKKEDAKKLNEIQCAWQQLVKERNDFLNSGELEGGMNLRPGLTTENMYNESVRSQEDAIKKIISSTF